MQAASVRVAAPRGAQTPGGSRAKCLLARTRPPRHARRPGIARGQRHAADGGPRAAIRPRPPSTGASVGRPAYPDKVAADSPPVGIFFLAGDRYECCTATAPGSFAAPTPPALLVPSAKKGV